MAVRFENSEEDPRGRMQHGPHCKFRGERELGAEFKPEDWSSRVSLVVPTGQKCYLHVENSLSL